MKYFLPILLLAFTFLSCAKKNAEEQAKKDNALAKMWLARKEITRTYSNPNLAAASKVRKKHLSYIFKNNINQARIVEIGGGNSKLITDIINTIFVLAPKLPISPALNMPSALISIPQVLAPPILRAIFAFVPVL